MNHPERIRETIRATEAERNAWAEAAKRENRPRMQWERLALNAAAKKANAKNNGAKNA